MVSYPNKIFQKLEVDLTVQWMMAADDPQTFIEMFETAVVACGGVGCASASLVVGEAQTAALGLKNAQEAPAFHQHTQSVAHPLFQFISRVGIPKEILTDQGTSFMSSTLRELYRLLGTKSILTSV